MVVAIIGKIAAGWVFSSDKPTNRLVVGLGMMPRGEVGLIFLGLGTSAKLLTPSLRGSYFINGYRNNISCTCSFENCSQR